MRSIFALTLLLLPYLSGAQSTEIRGVVYSGGSEKPLERVKVRMGNMSTRTDRQGRFVLVGRGMNPADFYHPRFDTFHLPYENLESLQTDTIYLTPVSSLHTRLREAGPVEVIYDKAYENVLQYGFSRDSLLVLSELILNKQRSRKEGFNDRVFSLMVRGEEIYRSIVPSNVRYIWLGRHGEIYLSGSETFLKMYRTPYGISFRPYSGKAFSDTLAKYQNFYDTGKYYIQTFPVLPLALLRWYDLDSDQSYTVYTAQNKKYFAYVSDDAAMLRPSEVVEAKDLAAGSGLNYELYSPFVRSAYLQRPTERPAVYGFTYPGAYYFFDLMNHTLVICSRDGRVERMTHTLSFASVEGEELRSMRRDAASGKIYAVYNRSGVPVIREINPATGAAGMPFKLSYPFASRINIIDGYVYYIHRSARSEKTAILVRQKLP